MEGLELIHQILDTTVIVLFIALLLKIYKNE
jgi:hypothetical protein